MLKMKKRLSKKERLESIRDRMFDGNMSAMGRGLGISPQVIKSWFDRETYLPCKLYEAFPQLDEHWLLTGEGEMLKAENAEPQVVTVTETKEIAPMNLRITAGDDGRLSVAIV